MKKKKKQHLFCSSFLGIHFFLPPKALTERSHLYSVLLSYPILCHPGNSREFPSPHAVFFFSSFALLKPVPTLLSMSDHPYQTAFMSARPHQATTGKVILPSSSCSPQNFWWTKFSKPHILERLN